MESIVFVKVGEMSFHQMLVAFFIKAAAWCLIIMSFDKVDINSMMMPIWHCKLLSRAIIFLPCWVFECDTLCVSRSQRCLIVLSVNFFSEVLVYQRENHRNIKLVFRLYLPLGCKSWGQSLCGINIVSLVQYVDPGRLQ